MKGKAQMSKTKPGPKAGPSNYEAELVRSARSLARLQTQRRKLRRQLRVVETEIRAERKTLKALAAANRDPDVVPSKLFGDGVGYKVQRDERVAVEPFELGDPDEKKPD
jgi:hypothetical protein